MNWSQINAKYPNAFTEYMKWVSKGICGAVVSEVEGALRFDCYDGTATSVKFNLRDLYDYFDQLKIYGQVMPCESTVDFNNDADEQRWAIGADWWWETHGYMYDQSDARELFKNRTAAESALFERMFQIREEQLAHSTSDTRKDSNL